MCMYRTRLTCFLRPNRDLHIKFNARISFNRGFLFFQPFFGLQSFVKNRAFKIHTYTAHSCKCGNPYLFILSITFSYAFFETFSSVLKSASICPQTLKKKRAENENVKSSSIVVSYNYSIF
jgi:hypothetical protein